jgi:hypothetical protein
MIRQLRRDHQLAFIFLALLLPILFVAGLALRRPMPRASKLPGQFLPTSNIIEGGGEGTLDLNSLRKSDVPDPLIYWSRERPSGNDPGNKAVLLGALSSWVGMGSLLPANAGEEGYLIVYSLAQKRVVDVRPWRRGAGQ